ncbi:hypothetical protein IAR55_002620 [Kwoniella newhampshirensis]|uniref:WD40 repeat-like protein n=1 Tax=Kwoniella newhampshirensis TaxID=1651941 RepID=A0AAW0YRI9_9TREE
MLSSDPPKISSRDFDPATMSVDDDAEERSDDVSTGVELSSVEINILVYLYLLESNFKHTAFTLLSESNLPQTSLFQHFNPSYPAPSANNPRKERPNGVTPGPATGKSPVTPTFGRSEGKIERGELVRKLWKALRWEEVERHVSASGEPYKPACPNPFHLLIPHVCPPSYPSSASNPLLPLPSALHTSPPPAKRPEVFPPPPESEPIAGPSKTSQAEAPSQEDLTTAGKSDNSRGKRKARRLSSDSASRNPSPVRSTSPSKGKSVSDRDSERKRDKQGGKKRARLSEGETKEDDGMDVDEEPKRNGEKKEVKISSPTKKGDSLNVLSESVSRATSPGNRSRKASPSAEAKGTSDGVPESDIGVFNEHRDSVYCVAWNPKNLDVLATGSGDGTAKLWEFQSGPSDHALTINKKPMSINHKGIESNKKNLTAVTWHPDGTMLATGSQDGVGRLFTPSGQLQAIMSYGRGAINALRFNPSGTSILTAKDDFTVCRWGHGQGYTMEMKLCFDAHTKEVNDVDWLDDEVFASGGNDHTIFVHRATDKRPRFTFKGHTDDVTRIKWSPALPNKPVSQRLLASVSDDGNCMIWRLPSYPERGGSRSLSPVKKNDSGEDDYFQNNTPVTGVDNCLHRLNVVSGSENKRMNTLEWSPSCEEGRMILAAGGQDSTVKVFDAISGECLHVLSGLESGTGSLAFSPRGLGGPFGALAAGGWDGHIVVWDVESGKKLLEHEIDEAPNKQSAREKPMMLTMAWREDGKHLACGLFNKSVMVVYVGGLIEGQAKVEEGK